LNSKFNLFNTFIKRIDFLSGIIQKVGINSNVNNIALVQLEEKIKEEDGSKTENKLLIMFKL
jgi:hypothetical protein